MKKKYEKPEIKEIKMDNIIQLYGMSDPPGNGHNNGNGWGHNNGNGNGHGWGNGKNPHGCDSFIESPFRDSPFE